MGMAQVPIFIPGILPSSMDPCIYVYVRSTQRNFLAYFEGNLHLLLKSGKDLMPIMSIGVRCVIDGTNGNTR